MPATKKFSKSGLFLTSYSGRTESFLNHAHTPDQSIEDSNALGIANHIASFLIVGKIS